MLKPSLAPGGELARDPPQRRLHEYKKQTSDRDPPPVYAGFSPVLVREPSRRSKIRIAILRGLKNAYEKVTTAVRIKECAILAGGPNAPPFEPLRSPDRFPALIRQAID